MHIIAIIIHTWTPGSVNCQYEYLPSYLFTFTLASFGILLLWLYPFSVPP